MSGTESDGGRSSAPDWTLKLTMVLRLQKERDIDKMLQYIQSYSFPFCLILVLHEANACLISTIQLLGDTIPLTSLSLRDYWLSDLLATRKKCQRPTKGKKIQVTLNDVNSFGTHKKNLIFFFNSFQLSSSESMSYERINIPHLDIHHQGFGCSTPNSKRTGSPHTEFLSFN